MSVIATKKYNNKVHLLLGLSAMYNSQYEKSSNIPSLNAKHEDFPRVFTDQKCKSHVQWNH